MGSATRESVTAAVAVLADQKAVDLATGEQLLAAALVVDGSPHLRAALSDDAADPADRRSIVSAVFGAYSAPAQKVLESLATGRWSSPDDLVGGIEQLGVRAVAASATKAQALNDELFAFSRAVASSSELELALGSKLGSTSSKLTLVNTLLEGKASAHALAIVRALVTLPRGRKTAELIRYATTIVAEQSGSTIATVTVASALNAEQTARLEKALSAQHGTAIRINQVVDAGVLGGMRVQIGDEVIDGTIVSRIADLRLRLAS